MQRDQILRKLNFDLLTPSPRVVEKGGSVDKIFATMLLHLFVNNHYKKFEYKGMKTFGVPINTN